MSFGDIVLLSFILAGIVVCAWCLYVDTLEAWYEWRENEEFDQ